MTIYIYIYIRKFILIHIYIYAVIRCHTVSCAVIVCWAAVGCLGHVSMIAAVPRSTTSHSEDGRHPVIRYDTIQPEMVMSRDVLACLRECVISCIGLYWKDCMTTRAYIYICIYLCHRLVIGKIHDSEKFGYIYDKFFVVWEVWKCM